jgi:hypothetical protein
MFSRTCTSSLVPCLGLTLPGVHTASVARSGGSKDEPGIR